MEPKMNRRCLAAAALLAGAFIGATDRVATEVQYQDAWGPPVGSALPSIAARDQADEPHDLASLSGERGLLLFAVRSADW